MATQTLEEPMALLDDLAEGLRAGEVVPYLGPGISQLEGTSVPMAPEELAEFFASKVTLPRRAVGNAWAAAQYIESYRHRQTVSAYMKEAFSGDITPAAFHRWLAEVAPPLVVDSWYAGEMRAALQGKSDWAEVQGTSRAVIGDDVWYRFYAPDGAELDQTSANQARTMLYTPHGSARPEGNFLISDADYVEVLTEIDIQTPIPEEIRHRRLGKSFLFIGCHFHDQLLRTYARQIIKRSSMKHYAVLDLDQLSRNEHRFLEEQGIVPIALPLADAMERLMKD